MKSKNPRHNSVRIVRRDYCYSGTCQCQCSALEDITSVYQCKNYILFFKNMLLAVRCETETSFFDLTIQFCLIEWYSILIIILCRCIWPSRAVTINASCVNVFQKYIVFYLFQAALIYLIRIWTKMNFKRLVSTSLKTLCGALTISLPPSLMNYWLWKFCLAHQLLVAHGCLMA